MWFLNFVNKSKPLIMTMQKKYNNNNTEITAVIGALDCISDCFESYMEKVGVEERIQVV